MAHEAAHLEPHGVPSSGMLGGLPRVLSDVKLEEEPIEAQQDGFGANLGIPGNEKLNCQASWSAKIMKKKVEKG